MLHIPDRIFLAALRSSVPDHQPLQPRVEIRCAVWRHGGEVCGGGVIAREELLLDFDEVAKGDAPPEGRGCDDEVREAARGGVGGRVLRGRGGHVVDVIGAVSVGQFLRGLVREFGEDEGGEGRGLRGGGGGVFR